MTYPPSLEQPVNAGSPDHYCRIPINLLTDSRLNHRDIRVYGVLAGSCWVGSVVTIGKRRIAQLTHCSAGKVLDTLKRLETTGHIRRAPVAPGQRGIYELLSPIFRHTPRAGQRRGSLTKSDCLTTY
jgi:hypothetical protein